MASTIKPNDDKPQSKYSIEVMWMVRVQEKIAHGEYVDGEWLANALRNSGGTHTTRCFGLSVPVPGWEDRGTERAQTDTSRSQGSDDHDHAGPL